MENTRILKFARFLVNPAAYLKPGEKIFIELHGHEYTLAKALVPEACKAGDKPFVSIHDYELERELVSEADDQHMSDVTSYELARMKDMDG
ncbi:MAG: aminopeptidase [Candidatus Cryosericum sp.]